jgi:hypothetical protein
MQWLEFVPGEFVVFIGPLLWVWYQQRKDDKATDRDATKPASTVRLIQRPKLYDWRSEKWL